MTPLVCLQKKKKASLLLRTLLRLQCERDDQPDKAVPVGQIAPGYPWERVRLKLSVAGPGTRVVLIATPPWELSYDRQKVIPT